MLTSRTHFYYLITGSIIGVAISYLLFQYFADHNTNKTLISPVAERNCDYNFERLQGYKHIKPLVWVHQNCESEKYFSLKTQITNFIQTNINSGNLNSASFYLIDLKQGDWISYNDQEKYQPGSLMKVPVMITILKMVEKNPELFNKKILYQQAFREDISPIFRDEMIQPGKYYTIKELLQRMIKYSDNAAATLLCQNLDSKDFENTFTDFGFKKGNLNESYPITSVEFSDYMEMLYNAGYLTIKDSEYATELLTDCNFKKGLMAQLPDSVQVAHKFGESGDQSVKELHESGIIYLNDSPYLLTIMTKGPDMSKLLPVVSSISGMIYQHKTQTKQVAESQSR